MPGPVPLPESPMECGLPEALSVRLSVAERGPPLLGVKVTLTGALFPGAMVTGRVIGWSAKSPALVPVMVMLLITRFAVPVFWMDTELGLLVVFFSWSAKVMLVGLAWKMGAVPVPATGIFSELPPALRSEERRVGKECRSRRSPYLEKKKQDT